MTVQSLRKSALLAAHLSSAAGAASFVQHATRSMEVPAGMGKSLGPAETEARHHARLKAVTDSQTLLKEAAALVSPTGSIAIHNAQVTAQKKVKRTARDHAKRIIMEARSHSSPTGRGFGEVLDKLVAEVMKHHPPYSQEQLTRCIDAALQKKR